MASACIILILIATVRHASSLSEQLWSKTMLPYSAFNTSNSKVLSDRHYFCPDACKCNTRSEIDCSNRELTRFPAKLESTLLNLNLAQNHIFNLTYEVRLEALKVLNVSQNALSFVDNQWLASLKNLQTLDLSRNFLSSKVVESAFQNVLLSYLNLSNNKLQEVSVSMFSKADALVSIDLSHNEIRDIDYDAFQNQAVLEVIDLSSNKLFEVKHDWFKNLKKLKTLNLKRNSLKFLRNVVFWPLNNLEFLDLSQNSIISVGLLSFKGLVKLEVLNISSNNISHFQEGVFRSLEAAQTIDLSQNSFKSTDKIFRHTDQLKALYMKKLHNFKALTSFSLQGLKSLQILDISGSQLSNINLEAFHDVRNLKEIDLSNSMLCNIKMGTFSKLHRVETIKLRGNPWQCDCHMYWIMYWLGEHRNTHLLSSLETLCESPLDLKGLVLLDALDHSMVCTNASISQHTNRTKFKVGSTAFLKCQVDGSPLPTLTWITPDKITFHWISSKNYTGSQNTDSQFSIDQLHDVISNEKMDQIDEQKRFHLLSNGNLAIRNVGRSDGGMYTCVASNPLGNSSLSIRLTLDYSFLVHVKIVSVLVGITTSFGFLLLTLISVLIRMILQHFRVKCPCHRGSSSPRTQQIKKLLENMEHYKKQQLDRLRDNYNVQVQRIKDNCMQQMERLRESYSSQAERLRDIRDYGTLQIDRIRENYYFQVQRVRDYSTSQIIRLRENYLFQRNRIRKFSTNHMYKLRENYKMQQQHLNKILENLNIESCRNVCQRTDSVVFEPDMTLDNILVPKICLQSFSKEICDSNDNSSQISAYFTPDEAGSEVSEDDRADGEVNPPVKCCLSNTLSETSVEMEPEEKADTNIPHFSRSQADYVFFKSTSGPSSADETIV